MSAFGGIAVPARSPAVAGKAGHPDYHALGWRVEERGGAAGGFDYTVECSKPKRPRSRCGVPLAACDLRTSVLSEWRRLSWLPGHQPAEFGGGQIPVERSMGGSGLDVAKGALHRLA